MAAWALLLAALLATVAGNGAVAEAGGGGGAARVPPALPAGCDPYVGSWLHDPSRAMLYRGKECNNGGRCSKKKGDRSGEYRWQPAGCALPALEPLRFLECMRGRRLAFVGDSVSNNFREALLCGLGRKGAPTTVGKRAHYAEYNFTVEGFRSNHLVVERTARKGGLLHLGEADSKWAAHLGDATDVVFTVGPHFSTLSRFSQTGGRTDPPVKPLTAAVGPVATTVLRSLEKSGFAGTALWTAHLPSHFKVRPPSSPPLTTTS